MTVNLHKDENRVQQEIYTWYSNAYCLAHHTPRCLIFHVPNQGQQHLTGIGVLAGVSDLIILHATHDTHTRPVYTTLLFIEVKDHKGRQSDAQKAFEMRVVALGYRYAVVRSLDEFKEVINNISH